MTQSDIKYIPSVEHQEYPPIENYAIIGDMRSNALISESGYIDWLCWPYHDSPASFLRMLDDQKGGYCGIDFHEGAEVVQRSYRHRTAILETDFKTATGQGKLEDCMVVKPLPVIPETGPDNLAPGIMIRKFTCTQGTVQGRFTIKPTFDFARKSSQIMKEQDRTIIKAEDDHLKLYIYSPTELLSEEQTVSQQFHLNEGETTYLIFSHNPTPLPNHLETVNEWMVNTESYWQQFDERSDYQGPYEELLRRSIITLKLLTFSPTGGIIAAATAGLPEAVPGNRNFDYRFVWIRDASFTLSSFVNMGHSREAGEYIRFMQERMFSSDPSLKIVYKIDGAAPDEQKLTHLRGWRGASPIFVGNAATDQEQYDIYGEYIVALHAYILSVNYEVPGWLQAQLETTLRFLVDCIIENIDKKDRGIWEFRSEPMHILHSKALIWVGLVRASEIGEHLGGISSEDIAQWRQKAESVRHEYLEKGWNEERQAYMQAYHSPNLDASVLRAVLFGAFEADSPRVKATLKAIEEDLTENELVYRYKMEDDGFEGIEATFLACAYWRLGCYALAGETERADKLYAHLASLAGPLGLYAEEIEADSGEHRGNFPQAFSQMVLINHAKRIKRAKTDQLNDEEFTLTSSSR